MLAEPQSGEVTVQAPDIASAGSVVVLQMGNREVVTDHYFSKRVEDEPSRFQNKTFVRLGASKGTVFRNVSFMHCVFDGCYLTSCVFDSCDFTGCRFLGSTFHQSSFTGCKFWYATFERTQIDDDVLTAEAPVEENLKVRFARTLRMNFSQLGDAKAVNKAISLELEATERYLRNSWSNNRSNYYRAKYPGFKQVRQFFRWGEFKILDWVWGNGESILKLVRAILAVLLVVAIYDVVDAGKARDLAAYWDSLQSAPGIFFGVHVPPAYPKLALWLIAASRYISLALLTALLVKRLGRR